MTLDTILTLIFYLAASFVLFAVGKLIYSLFHRDINVGSELVEKDNLAFAISHAGYFSGMVIAIGGALSGPSMEIIMDLYDILIYGLLSIILLNISLFICDKIILSKFSTRKEIIEDQNAGTAVVEAAVSIGTGLIIFAAVSGEGGSIVTALGYWAIGQIVMLLVTVVYNLITPYDIHEHIEKDNVAAGVGFAGAILALSNVIRSALMGDFYSWTETFSDLWLYLVVGLISLPVVRFLADKILLPGRKLTDEIVNQEKPNVGAAVIAAFAYIGGSMFICWSL